MDTTHKIPKATQKKLMLAMVDLEQKLHGDGTLTDEEHQHLEKLHSLHGAGLFNDIKMWVWKHLHPIGRLHEHLKTKGMM